VKREAVGYREGDFTSTIAASPLLVSFSGGEGRVAFGSFRFVANGDADMRLVLQYLMHEL
jgi:hypothetical protein